VDNRTKFSHGDNSPGSVQFADISYSLCRTATHAAVTHLTYILSSVLYVHHECHSIFCKNAHDDYISR